MSKNLWFGVCAAIALAGCGGNGAAGDADSGVTFDGGGTVDSGTTELCGARVVACQEASFTELALRQTPAPEGKIADESDVNEAPEGVFFTHIDATGGGVTPSQSYVYARFTETGLEQVDISDDEALASTEWDLAFRRFVIRLNSGYSGPSCVTAVRASRGDDEAPIGFDGVTEAPADGYESESYFVEDPLSGECEFLADLSGLPSSPGTLMSSYWIYSEAGCVSMTNDVFVLALRDGRHVKVEVLSYYTPDNQEACDSGEALGTPSGSGNIRLKWSYLD